MARRNEFALALLFLPALVQAQPGTGETWDTFGPDKASGVFVNITREHRINEYAQGIAVDGRKRVLVLNSWREAGNSNSDCAVTRHINNARVLDMSYTGPDDLEGTRRVAADMGGVNADICTSIDVDSGNKAVISGWGTREGGLSGFVVRLNATGGYDSTFSTDGKLALSNLAPFSNLNTLANQVLAVDDKVLVCGWVKRGSSNNMLVLRLNSAGQLDTSFSGNGYVEVDFGVGNGTRDDDCSRLVVLPDGDIIAGGTVTNTSQEPAYGFARFNSNGSFDGSFGNSGRLIVDDNSQLAVTPSFVDMVWDAPRNRLMAGCNLNFSALLDSACVIAIKANGDLDTAFDQDGRVVFGFSTYAGVFRGAGSTYLQRMLIRDDGDMYLLGTLKNEDPADFEIYEEKDIAVLRMESNGSVIESGPNAFAGIGMTIPLLSEANHEDTNNGEQYRTTEEMVDATWYKGNILFIVDRARYQRGLFDHDEDGNLDEQGPIAPVVAALSGEHLFGADFDFDGLDGDLSNVPVIPVPAGYGHYCSVHDPASGEFGLAAQGTISDPCQGFLDQNPDLFIDRAGLYSLNGVNWVIGTCSGGFITIRAGIGGQPFNAAFADAAGRSRCVFTATPKELPIFSRPYTGSHDEVGNTQSFNHDGYNISIDVADFGQPNGGFNSCYIDNQGRDRSIGDPDANPETCEADNSGVNEVAMDIDVVSPRQVASVAPGKVVMAVPRHVVFTAPVYSDPWQRVVLVRHQVGSGQYAEIFTTYYAHMQNTNVRRGNVLDTGDLLGLVGTTGSSTNEHLHLGVFRNKNLTYRRIWELDFEGARYARYYQNAAVDPFGWNPANGLNGVDPWGWRFRNHASDPNRDNAGSFSSDMWLPGEAPPLQ